jgi:ABC-type polysaccharide/polyol phosphate export permease
MKVIVYILLIQCVQKVTAHLQKVLEVMPTSVYAGLNPFNFHSQTLYKVLEVMPISANTDNQIYVPYQHLPASICLFNITQCFQ